MKRKNNLTSTVSMHYLRNLARCRAAYGDDQGKDMMLLENTMSEIQDLLHSAGIDWTDFDPCEDLES